MAPLAVRDGGTVQWRTSERIIRANERLIEYLHRACGHTRGGAIHSPEAVRCAWRPKCARRVSIAEEFGNFQTCARKPAPPLAPSRGWKRCPPRPGSSARVRPCRSPRTAHARATTTYGRSGCLPGTAAPLDRCCRRRSLWSGVRPDPCRRHCTGGRGCCRAGGRSKPSTWGRACHWAEACSAPSSPCSSRTPRRARTLA